MIRRACKFVLFASALTTGGVLAWGTSRETVVGSGKATTEERIVGPVTEVVLNGIGNLTLAQGDVPELTVTADHNILPLIETATSGTRLTIGTRSGFNLQPKGPITYSLTLPRLEKLTVSGVGNVTGEKLLGESLTVKLSGAGNATLRGIGYKNVSLTLNGAGGATLTGGGEKATLRLSGAGEIDAGMFSVKTADVQISGAGHATVWTTDHLKGRVSGSGEIAYKGLPKLDLRTSSASKVRPLVP